MKSLLSSFIKLALKTSTEKTVIYHQRCLSFTPFVLRSIRDDHRAGTKFTNLNSDEMFGTTGATNFLSVNTKDVDQHLPTVETLKQVFDQIPFNELPIAYIKASRNNTIIQVFDNKNTSCMYTSCRLEGFQNARKKTTIAGQTTGVAAGQKLLRRGIRTVRVIVKGIGPGRMASVKGMALAGVNIVSITDRTPLPELGPRPKKIRRV